MPKMRPLFIGLIGVVGCGFGLALWWLWQHPYAADPLVYRPAPDYVFERADLNDARAAPRDWDGHPYLISFFASWCRPCHAEHPVLMELAQNTSLLMVGVAHHDRLADTMAMLQKMGNPYQLVLRDFSGDGARAWRLSGVPESFLVDATGEIIWHRRGPLTHAVMRDQILPLVASLAHE